MNSIKKINTLRKSKLNNCLQYSNGDLYPSDLRGLWLSFHSISASISSVSSLKSVHFGMNWRISPFVFSFAPRSQEWCGRAK